MKKAIFLTAIATLLTFITSQAATNDPDTIASASTAKRVLVIRTKSGVKVAIASIEGNNRKNFYYQADSPGRIKRLDDDSEPIAPLYHHNDTVMTFEDVSDVTLSETRNGVTVYLTDAFGNNQEYSYNYLNPDNVAIRSRRPLMFKDGAFHIGSGRHTTWELITSGLGIGWSTTPGAHSAFSQKPGRSVELTWMYVLGVRMKYRANSLTMGVGLDWRNYTFAGPMGFTKGDGQIEISPYPDGATEARSRIKVFSLQVPIQYAVRLGKGFALSAAPILNFNLSSSVKSNYHYNGSEYTIKAGNVFQRKVTVDFMGAIHYDVFALYARYSPMKVLKSGCGPQFSTFTAGVMLFF